MKSSWLSRPNVPEPDRTPWLAALDHLFNDIERWCAEKGWQAERFDVEIDEGFGDYSTKALSVTSDKGRIHFEPIGQIVAGTQGRVDMLAWPALYRSLLLWKANHNPTEEWTLELDSGIDWPDGWNQKSFYTFVNLLTTRK